MVNKRSTTGTSGTNATINVEKRKPNTIQANLVTEIDTVVEAEAPAAAEVESASVTTAKLVEDSGEFYTDHPNFDMLFLDETVKSNSSVIHFNKHVDKILLFDLKKSSPWSSRGTPAKPTSQASRIAPS